MSSRVHRLAIFSLVAALVAPALAPLGAQASVSALGGTKDGYALGGAYASGITARLAGTAGTLANGVPSAYASADSGASHDRGTRPAVVVAGGTLAESVVGAATAEAWSDALRGESRASFAFDGIRLAGGLVRLTTLEGSVFAIPGGWSTEFRIGRLFVNDIEVPGQPAPGSTMPVPGGTLSFLTVSYDAGRPILTGLELRLDTGDVVRVGLASAWQAGSRGTSSFAPSGTASAIGSVPPDPSDRGILAEASGTAARAKGWSAWDAPRDALPGILDVPAAVAPAGGAASADIEDGRVRVAASMRVPTVDLLGGLVTAVDVVSSASGVADSATASLAGGATFGALRLGGVAVGPTPPPNAAYDLGIARVVLNEQSRAVSLSPATGLNHAVGTLTAMRVIVTAANPFAPVGTEYVIARTFVEAKAYRPIGLDLTATVDRTLVHAGDPVVASFRVANTGATTLQNVVVTIDNVAACSLGAMAPATVKECAKAVNPSIDTYYSFAASGSDATGRPATDTERRYVDVIRPGLAVAARSLDPTVRVGEVARHEFTVTNTGDTPLRDVVVNDSMHGRVCSYALLPIAAARTCNFTAPADATATHRAGASGVDELGRQVSATAAFSQSVFRTGLAMTLGSVPPVVRAGGVATFPLTVANTGDVALANVVVSQAGTTACTFATLAAGATLPCHPARAVSADTTFVFDAVAHDPLGDPLTARASVFVRTITPSLLVTSAASREVTHSNESVRFTYRVTNTGDSPLTDVRIADDLGTVCAGLALAPGGRAECSRERLFPADGSNAASASGLDELGLVVAGAAPPIAIKVVFPAISLSLAADRSVARPGDVVKTTYTARNVGDTTLYDVDVVDTLLGGVCTLSSLAPGATASCTALGPARKAAVDSRACGVDGLGRAVCAAATLLIALADGALEIRVAPNATQTRAGWPVTYTYTVSNAGTTNVFGAVVSDSHLGTICSPGTLAAGQVTTCTRTTTLTASRTNTATVTGSDAAGSLSASHAATVTVLSPAISLSVSITPSVVPDNSTATYTFIATNTGNALLLDLEIASDVTGVACAFGGLAPGRAVACRSLAHVNLDTVRSVSATARAVDELGKPVAAAASALLKVSAIRLNLTAIPQETERLAHEQPVVEFRYRVTNPGDVALANVVVTAWSAHVCTIPTLGAGATATCVQPRVLLSTNITRAKAQGTDTGGNVLVAEDALIVPVNLVGLVLEKEATPYYIEPGTVVTYNYTVRNTGKVALRDITVFDDLLGEICYVGTLDANKNATCIVETPVYENTTNVGIATARTPLDRMLVAVDTATVVLGTWSIEIQKTADPVLVEMYLVRCGPKYTVACFPAYVVTPVTYTYAVTNTGTVPLAFNVTDDHLGRICHGAIDAGETHICEITVEVYQNTTNVADVVALTPLGRRVDASAEASVIIVRPRVQIDVAIVPEDPSFGSRPRIDFTATNTGETHLYDIAITDSYLGEICVIPFLKPGDSETCSAKDVYEEPQIRHAHVDAWTPLGNWVWHDRSYMFGNQCESIYLDGGGYACVEMPLAWFEDISWYGTPITLGDDEVSAPIPLLFDFPFYSDLYDTLYVSSNGFVTLGHAVPSSGCCAGEHMPSISSPDNMIAAWHADLNPAAGGSIHYADFGNMFIVQWTDVPHYPNSLPVTMQVVLYWDGLIDVNILNGDSTGSFHTVGIENIDGTVGTTAIHTTSAITDPTTYRFFR